jgi:hypothetical protein
MKNYFCKYLILLITIAATAVFWQNKILLFGLLSLIAFILLRLDSFKLIKEFFAIATFGTVTEIIIINFSQAWSYATSDWLLVPAWLFPLWGIAGILAINIYFYLNDKKIRPSSKKLLNKLKS